MTVFRCESGTCEATFEHPGDEDDCESIDGQCALLVRAGWRQVWVRVELEPKRVLFARGGWLCPECVRRYTPRKVLGKGLAKRRATKAAQELGKALGSLLVGPSVAMATNECPRCKGVLVDDSLGLHCSRRYAKRSPCGYEAPS